MLKCVECQEELEDGNLEVTFHICQICMLELGDD